MDSARRYKRQKNDTIVKIVIKVAEIGKTNRLSQVFPHACEIIAIVKTKQCYIKWIQGRMF